MASHSIEAPWYAKYPVARSQKPATISPHEILQFFMDGKVPGKDFALIDLRRTDFEGGTIRGSINLPAQSLYPTLPTLYILFKSAGITKVIWYCESSKGRGTRAAAWFEDHLEDLGDDSIQSLVLSGGIKGWVEAGQEYTGLMLEYDSEIWHKAN